MRFAHPQMLWLLAVTVSLLAFFFWCAWRKKQFLVAQFVQSRLLAQLTIGVGTRGLAPIPYVDAFGRKGYKQQQVDIDEDTLTQIAKRTGGKYYRADKTETLRSVYDEIDQLEKTEVEVKKYQRYRELFPWVALPGLVVLLLEVILNHTVWRKLP